MSGRKLVSGRKLGALGAVSAQFSQAAGSFLLQVLTLRFLGVEGLGRFAMAYGVILIVTSVVTGLTGDSLTVLDRSRPEVRAGLQTWLVAVAVVGGLAMGAIAAVGGWLSPAESAVFGLAGLLFVLEDALRRLLMASLRFWSLVVVDVCALVFSVGVVVLVRAGGEVTLLAPLAGLALGQGVAGIVAVVLLPREERWLARGVRPDLAAVWRYGSWRALQQMLRPTMLAVIRVVVSVAVSLAAYGALEAARVYVAPAMLAVAGISSFFFASYARDHARPLHELRRRADTTVIGLALSASAVGLVATALVPVLGPLLVTGDDELNRLAVLGWAAYAAGTATVTPYGSLAAVRGQQAAVLGFCAAESVLSVVACAVLLALGMSPFAVPLVLAALSVVGGCAMRNVLLREPQAASGSPAPRDATVAAEA